MGVKINELPLPKNIKIETSLTPAETPRVIEGDNPIKRNSGENENSMFMFSTYFFIPVLITVFTNS